MACAARCSSKTVQPNEAVEKVPDSKIAPFSGVRLSLRGARSSNTVRSGRSIFSSAQRNQGDRTFSTASTSRMSGRASGRSPLAKVRLDAAVRDHVQATGRILKMDGVCPSMLPCCHRNLARCPIYTAPHLQSSTLFDSRRNYFALCRKYRCIRRNPI